MTSRGVLIALEGIDGAGKTAAAEVVVGSTELLRWPVTLVSKQHPPLTDAYLEAHFTQLRKLIWEHPPDDPFYLLGQAHWIHLIASWFAALSHCAIVPMLERGVNILVDNWIGKSLARMRLNEEIDYERAWSFFKDIPRPDLVVLLDVEPSIAAGRKAAITAIEAGCFHPEDEIRLENYLRYQTRLRRQLSIEAVQESWRVVDVGSRGLADVAAAVAGIINEVLEERRKGLVLA